VLLALDARNRTISLGFRSGGVWLARRRVAAAPVRSSDEYALLLKAFARDLALAHEIASEGEVGEAWMSSVVPSLTRPLREAVESAFGIPCSIVGPGVRTGVRIRTDIPSEVGSDLVCTAVAAANMARRAAVVVHFGAAIAVSALGKNGDFLGVAIAPGFYTGIESLRASAALLPEVTLAQSMSGAFDDGPPAQQGTPPIAPTAAPPRGSSFGGLGTAIGKNTAQSVRAGMCLGYAGLVERIVRAQIDELVSSGEADATGEVEILGSGSEEGCAIFEALGFGRFVPDLVLEGLAIIAGRAPRR
jgi:type III pantothenate kinase